MPHSPQVGFPQIRRIELTGFTLYQRQPTVILDVPKGVLCLAGANGIGKSTLLAATNYGLTGSVPEPRRSLTSKRGYFEDAANYTARFFDGRIGPDDRDVAEVMVEMDLGNQRWALRRGVFDGRGLRRLSITNATTGKLSYNGDKHSSEERQAQYETRLAKEMGLEAFEQFVFLQHFVLTFDEGRDLLFWNQPALERILRISFGESVTEAHRADALRRDAAKAGSLGRNYQWQATTLQGQIRQLREALGQQTTSDEDPQDSANEYLRLVEEREELEQQISQSEGRLNEATAAFADAAAHTVSLRSAYDVAFSEELNGMRADPTRAPIIQRLIAAHQCDACGAHHDDVAAAAQLALQARRCPVCATSLAVSDGKVFDRLREIDEELGAATEAQATAAETRARYHADHVVLREQYHVVCSKIVAFESSHGTLAAAARQRRESGSSPGADSLAALEASHALMVSKRAEEYARRDELLEELAVLNKALEQRYLERRDEFTGLFRSLAGDFLGLPVDVQLTRREGDAIGLEFSLRHTVRRAEHALSESQRFFVDIALRMAIARFISKGGGPAALFIDTPEGSLDIAYEIRAGELFASFVNLGHSILMTANINTSRLLLALATRCTAALMTLVRMTEWAALSEVQEQHETDFAGAFAAIESALAAS